MSGSSAATPLRLAMVQFCAGDCVAGNLTRLEGLIRQAAASGAELIATPEVSNIVTAEREMLFGQIVREAEDAGLRAFRALATELSVSLLLGSFAFRAENGTKAVNRSLFITRSGEVAARYDKIHMFDAEISAKDRYRESAGYAAGHQAVLLKTSQAGFGLSICYDLRFAHLYRQLAEAGAQIIFVPAVFTRATGRAHWHILLRARAIETGCFIVAPAQDGVHPARAGARRRESYGHSLVVSPWGDILADGGEGEKIVTATLDLAECEDARRRVPALHNCAAFSLKTCVAGD